MKLSVVTITFNNFLELKATLESIPKNANIESVVINGGSCADTLSFLKLHSQELVSISEKDEGISDAFNKGIALSSGDCITFLNSGDLLIDPGYYDFALKTFSHDPMVDYVYADILFEHREHGQLLVKPNSNIGKTPFPHPSLIVKKKVFDQVGGFDKTLKVAMDFDFMCKMIKQKYRGHYYSDKPVVLMDGNGASSSNGFRGIRERLLVLNRYDLVNFESKVYLNILIAKTHARELLGKMGWLGYYDKIKKKIFTVKAE